MSVTVLINGVTLIPQPASVDWKSNSLGGKLDATEAIGAAETVILKAPVGRGGTASWNWSAYENQILTSITVPARFSTMRDTGTTYSSGVVSKRIKDIQAPPGGLVYGVELEITVVI